MQITKCGHKRIAFKCILAILVSGETRIRLLKTFWSNIELFTELSLNAAFIFTWEEMVLRINHYTLWQNCFSSMFICKHSHHSVNNLWREWSCLCLYLPSPLFPWETLFTWIILFNARGPLMYKVIFMFRPLLDQPVWHKTN